MPEILIVLEILIMFRILFNDYSSWNSIVWGKGGLAVRSRGSRDLDFKIFR
jgi:hypothetical protein